jgi:hypothetical protein
MIKIVAQYIHIGNLPVRDLSGCQKTSPRTSLFVALERGTWSVKRPNAYGRDRSKEQTASSA